MKSLRVKIQQNMKYYGLALFVAIGFNSLIAQDDVYDNSYTPMNQSSSTTINENNYSGNANSTSNADSYEDKSGNTYVTNNYYGNYLNDDYDYRYSSRIRRFHRHCVNYNYFDDYYINRYWYDPFYSPFSSIYDPYDDYWTWHFRPRVFVSINWGWPSFYSWGSPYAGWAWNSWCTPHWGGGYYGHSGWYGNGWGYNAYNNGYWAGYNDGWNNNNWYSGSNPNAGNYYHGPRHNRNVIPDVTTVSGVRPPVSKPVNFTSPNANDIDKNPKGVSERPALNNSNSGRPNVSINKPNESKPKDVYLNSDRPMGKPNSTVTDSNIPKENTNTFEPINPKKPSVVEQNPAPKPVYEERKPKQYEQNSTPKPAYEERKPRVIERNNDAPSRSEPRHQQQRNENRSNDRPNNNLNQSRPSNSNSRPSVGGFRR